MRKIFLIVGLILILGALGVGIWLFLRGDLFRSSSESTEPDNVAIQAGQTLSHNKCSGTGAGTLTHLPMNFDDFAIIIPYGLLAGGHVTPIDHQYYSPTVFNSPRDAYPVFAMADARLVDIQSRTTDRGVEYRMVFSMTCTFLYYYDLVTSLAPDIEAIYDQEKNSQGYAGDIDIQVTAGQLIGRIGGQTLDFAVWDTTKPLSGFVNPESYQSEPWKIYTADPLEYSTEEIKSQMLDKYIRVAEPRSGKIDHDADGRLIGNWFLEGSGGYGGSGEPYWSGHLAVVPEHLDPTASLISFGSYQGEARQFSIPRSSPNPTEVSTETGLVKYDLLDWQYLDGQGGEWDRVSFPGALPLSLYNDNFPKLGCVLLQLVEDRRLKMEAFPGRECSAVTSFTSAAGFYTR